MVFSLLFLLLLLPIKTQSENPNIVYCPGGANYTDPSPFKTNLDTLLANLTSTTTVAARFITATSGAATSHPVYGLAQCRPDTSDSSCSDCLNRSAADAAARCPRERSFAVRYEYCVLRFSDSNFISQLEDLQLGRGYLQHDSADPAEFKKRLKGLMGTVLAAAANAESRFGVGMTNDTGSDGVIYGLGECTRDLSVGDCLACVQYAFEGLQSCCAGKTGGGAAAVSCKARYEMYPFFSLSVVPPPPSSLPPPLPSPPPPPLLPLDGTRSKGEGKRNNAIKVAAIAVISVVFVLVLPFAICIYLRRRKTFRKTLFVDEDEFRSAESLLFDLGTLKVATNNFSDANKLGEGGFGQVYKGVLPNGEEIAIKRLSQSSSQGLVELKNEVVLVAKLHHRNLVRLMGCCLEEQEKLLVYEYLPNTSLDKFLFDHLRRQQLHWSRRYKIIEGISRGLLYLHEDSRIRIVHLDLKASNILLDVDMNPKISDFGLAKLFGMDETQRNTNRIAGTYGYMAPEYALHGHCSTKSDVFSYGVLVLEIVTGRKNSGFQGSGRSIDLLSYVWHHWNEGAALQVKDRSLQDNLRPQEILRCIQIGLLCVQEDPRERPSMATVVLMLSSHSVTLAIPSAPAFLFSDSSSKSDLIARDVDFDLSKKVNRKGDIRASRAISVNDVSISEMDPR